ncbi:MAG: lycopene cyclase domain-containing protein [Patescibacteria group bacterium]
MIIDFKFAYFVLVIPFIIVWIIFFVLSRKTRIEQLIMSFLFLGVGVISENLFYFHDYWSPESILSFNIGSWRILLEDILFSFTIAGIGSIIYEMVFNKRLESIKKINFVFKLLSIIVIGLSSFYLLFFIGINSILATSIGFIILSLFIMVQRKDLLTCSLFSGLGILVINFCAYIVVYLLIRNSEELIRRGWMLYETSFGIRILGIPVTEMIWGFTAGAFIGPLYKFIFSKKLSK